MGSALCLEYNSSWVFKWKVVNIKSRNWSLKQISYKQCLAELIECIFGCGVLKPFFPSVVQAVDRCYTGFSIVSTTGRCTDFLLDSQKALSETFWQLCKDQIGRIDLTNGFIRLSKLVVLNFISNTSWNWKCLIAKASWYQGQPSGLKSWSQEGCVIIRCVQFHYETVFRVFSFDASERQILPSHQKNYRLEIQVILQLHCFGLFLNISRFFFRR